MTERPRHKIGRVGLMLAAMLGSAAPPPEMLGAPKTEIVDQRRRKHHRPPLRGMFRLWPWSDMVKHGWRKNGRGDRLNPKREERRKMAATVMEYTGRKLSGRQWKKLRRGY